MESVEAISKIEELVKNGLTVNVDGQEFSAADLEPVVYEPRPATVAVNTLNGFCGFIENDIDGRIKREPHLIVVHSHEKVSLISAAGGRDNARTGLVSAVLNRELEMFPFGQFLSQEEFAIRFRSLFVRNEGDDYDYVLEYASKLVGSTAVEITDDGISQEVGVKKGVTGLRTEKTVLKPVVRLSPYRTFRDIGQPQSEFVFRVRMNKDDAPTVALFEADGGAWINTAMDTIVDFIRRQITDIPVIA